MLFGMLPGSLLKKHHCCKSTTICFTIQYSTDK